ncbi:MAG: hypothetical protein JSR98_13125 [Proteobacteria bacterium]|nr:hypothetical protein [Pseudomonadota bacterium]
MSDAPHSEVFAKPEALLRVPVGFASPLWGLFAGAALSGSAWWWMTRFARVENLEAMFGAAEAQAAKVAVLPLPAVETAAGAALETLDSVEEMVETVAEPATEAIVEAEVAATAGPLDRALDEAPAAILEAVDAADELLAPVGGESAPISPLVAAMALEPEAPEPEAVEPDVSVEAEAAAKPRKRATTPKLD